MTPNGYEESGKKYPVLYINDGQDVFEDKDIIWGECSMEYKKYYQRYARFLPELVLVAISCPEEREERTKLYSPFRRFKPGENQPVMTGIGSEYLSWITDTLKPWVDSHFRVYTDGSHTGIMGYSTGGMFAVFAGLARPDVFTRIAALSSAVYIWKEDLTAFLDNADYSRLQYVYLDVGTNEFGRITTKEEFLKGADILNQAFEVHGIDSQKLIFNCYPGAIHSQTEWKKRFPDAIRWIFQDA